MLEFITLITLLCSQPGVGHGNSNDWSTRYRQEAFLAQSSCTKRLFKACPYKAYSIDKSAACLVEHL